MTAVYEIDGSAEGLKAAMAAIRDGEARIVLQGVVRNPRFIPQPAIGELIRRYQRVERQLLLLADEAREAGADFELVLPGRAPLPQARHEQVALRPAAA